MKLHRSNLENWLFFPEPLNKIHLSSPTCVRTTCVRPTARMSLPICALAGSPLMFFYTLSVLLAPLLLAQYFSSFHPRDALHRPGESAPWAP